MRWKAVDVLEGDQNAVVWREYEIDMICELWPVKMKNKSKRDLKVDKIVDGKKFMAITGG